MQPKLLSVTISATLLVGVLSQGQVTRPQTSGPGTVAPVSPTGGSPSTGVKLRADFRPERPDPHKVKAPAEDCPPVPGQPPAASSHGAKPPTSPPLIPLLRWPRLVD